MDKYSQYMELVVEMSRDLARVQKLTPNRHYVTPKGSIVLVLDKTEAKAWDVWVNGNFYTTLYYFDIAELWDIVFNKF